MYIHMLEHTLQQSSVHDVIDLRQNALVQSNIAFVKDTNWCSLHVSNKLHVHVNLQFYSFVLSNA